MKAKIEMSSKKKAASTPKQEEINLRNFLEGQVTVATQARDQASLALVHAEGVIVIFKALLDDYNKLELASDPGIPGVDWAGPGV